MAEEPKVPCPSCGKEYRWNPKYAGRKVQCKCGQVMTFPAEPPAAEPAAEEEVYELNLDEPVTPAAPAAAPPPRPVRKPEAAPAAAERAPSLNIELSTDEGHDENHCPSCNADIRPGAIICMSCGFNLKEGKKLDMVVAEEEETAAKGKTEGKARAAAAPAPVTSEQAAAIASVTGRTRSALHTPALGFFGKLNQSWQFACISYGIIWDFKALILFPILSAIAAIAVLASFLLPVWRAGLLDPLLTGDTGAEQPLSPLVYVAAFGLYFCNFFVIVFFNTALIACAMKVIAGQPPSLGYGISVAVKRLPQIAAWALVSAIVGVVLKMIENSNEKVGRIIAALLGTGWTILTFFVVPVLAVEGVGPITAVKRAAGTLRQTWGEAAIGNFSMGMLTLLVTLPVYVIIGALLYLAAALQIKALLIGVLAGSALAVIIIAAVSSAADTVFKAVLYNYATGRDLPQGVDEDVFAHAFGHKQ